MTQTFICDRLNSFMSNNSLPNMIVVLNKAYPTEQSDKHFKKFLMNTILLALVRQFHTSDIAIIVFRFTNDTAVRQLSSGVTELKVFTTD